MTNDFSKYRLLKDYLKNVHETFPDDLLNDMEAKDPDYVRHIRDAESELARLNFAITRERRQTAEMEEQSLPFDYNSSITDAYPPRPKQSIAKKSKTTTMLTPLSSIVEEGYEKQYNGINWPHFENMLKLYALDFFIDGTPTEQQKKDIAELTEAIEFTGNMKYKKKHLTAKEILDGARGAYMNFGRRVINAMAEPDPYASEVKLNKLRFEISDTYNEINAGQLNKVMHKADAIFRAMRSRYREKE